MKSIIFGLFKAKLFKVRAKKVFLSSNLIYEILQMSIFEINKIELKFTLKYDVKLLVKDIKIEIL